MPPDVNTNNGKFGFGMRPGAPPTGPPGFKQQKGLFGRGQPQVQQKKPNMW